MNPPPLRIATRRSALALWQAEHVAGRLRLLDPGRPVELLPLTTEGDRNLGASLAQSGGKGLFIKELEMALADGRADLAVHSMKDVPVELAPEFVLAATLEREDPRDAYLSVRYPAPENLPTGARVGSSSLRRQSQLLHHRPDLHVEPLRGNVDTRLRKLDEGAYDAVILAAAGLKRLGLAHRITALLDVQWCLPAIAQGAIGLECRADDTPLRERLERLNHAETWIRIRAERALSRGLSGSCNLPLAGYAELHADRLHLQGAVGSPDGRRLLRDALSGPAAEPERLGTDLAGKLLAQGAADVLKEIQHGG